MGCFGLDLFAWIIAFFFKLLYSVKLSGVAQKFADYLEIETHKFALNVRTLKSNLTSSQVTLFNVSRMC